MTDGMPEPQVFEGELTPEQLRDLVTQLLEHAQLLSVRTRAGAGSSQGDAAATPADQLVRAVDALAAGEIQATQIRYRHDGVTWCDTLMAGASGARVIRSRLD